MPAEIEIITRLVQLGNSTIQAASNLASAATENKMEGAVVSLAVGARASEEAIKSFVTTAVTSSISKVLSDTVTGAETVPFFAKVLHKELTKGEFGDVPPETYKKLKQEQQAMLQQSLFEYHHGLEQKPDESPVSQQQRNNLFNLFLGEAPKTPSVPQTLSDLELMAPQLRDLPEAERNKIIAIVRFQTKQYNELGFHFNQSENSALLSRHFAPVKDSLFQSLYSQLRGKLSSEFLELMENKDFPDNVPPEYLIEKKPEFMALCQIREMEEEYKKQEKVLRDKNGGEVLTPTEKQKAEEGYVLFKESLNVTGSHDLPVATASHEEYMSDCEKEKIMRNMDMGTFIRKEIRDQAKLLQNKQSETMEKIIAYLERLDPNSNLAGFINSPMSALLRQQAVVDSLQEHCYEGSFQQVRDAYQEQLKDQGLSAKLDRGAALDFYKNKLADPTKRAEIMAEFRDALKNLDSPEQCKLSTGMAQIASLMGMLNVADKKDKEALVAYESILKEMMTELRDAILLKKPNNEKLCKDYMQLLNLLNSIGLTSFAVRGLRFEELDNIKNTVSGALTGVRVGCTVATYTIPVVAAVTVPTAAFAGILSTLLDVKNFAADIKTRAQLSILQHPIQNAETFHALMTVKVDSALHVAKQNQLAILLKKNVLQSKGYTQHDEKGKCVRDILKRVEQIQSIIEQTQSDLKKMKEHHMKETDEPHVLLAKEKAYEDSIKERIAASEEQVKTLASEVGVLEDKLKTYFPAEEQEQYTSFIGAIK